MYFTLPMSMLNLISLFDAYSLCEEISFFNASPLAWGLIIQYNFVL